MRVCLWCPDRHLVYDGTTADEVGVGGGVTARIRLGAALASLGHKMTVICNAPKERTVDGVRYVPLDAPHNADADVLIMTTSGGDLDLAPSKDLGVTSKLRVVWVHGVAKPKALDEVPYDALYAVSNFIRRTARDEWKVTPERIYVSHNGIVRPEPSRRFRKQQRSMHRLAYTSHPAKGLAAATAILRLLRARDPRNELHVFGSEALWGRKEKKPQQEPGVVHHGLVGQKALFEGLASCGVLLNIQAVQDAFALAPAEAMSLGCVVIASPVGGYPELIRSGFNGFLVPGDHLDPETHTRAAALVEGLVADADHADYIRRNGLAWPLEWETIARAWTGHWRWLMSGERPSSDAVPGPCRSCGGAFLPLADGYHCRACGLYTRDGTETD